MCPPCPDGQSCQTGADCASTTCMGGVCVPFATACPTAGVADDCTAALPPGTQGGDLLWAQTFDVTPDVDCVGGIAGWPITLGITRFAPTGSTGLALGAVCDNMFAFVGAVFRLGGPGIASYDEGSVADGSRGVVPYPWIGRRDDLIALIDGGRGGLGPPESWSLSSSELSGEVQGSGVLADLMGSVVDTDALGNIFFTVSCYSCQGYGAISVPSMSTYLVRGSATGESYLSGYDMSGSFAADQTGGVYLYGALASAKDFGCGPVSPSSSTSTYLARLSLSWGCLYSRALPVGVGLLPAQDGSVTLTASATTALDLGCGSLPAAAGGSTFVTRLDGSGNCVFGRSLPSPSLNVALDPSGDVVVSGLVGASSIDLGGGALPPLGTQDLVLAELSGTGAYLWGKRIGAAGISLAMPTPVRVSGAGNLYLRVQPSGGSVDLGGGPLANDVIGSLSGAGSYRWSRALPFKGTVITADFDGCGAFMAMSQTHDFDPGCGPVVPPDCASLPPGCTLSGDCGTCNGAPLGDAYPEVQYVGVARYAP